MTRKPNWQTTPNARRARPMVTITLDRKSLTEIDARRGKLSRGEFIELLLETTTTPDEAAYEASMANFAAQCPPLPKKRKVRR